LILREKRQRLPMETRGEGMNCSGSEYPSVRTKFTLRQQNRANNTWIEEKKKGEGGGVLFSPSHVEGGTHKGDKPEAPQK